MSNSELRDVAREYFKRVEQKFHEACHKMQASEEFNFLLAEHLIKIKTAGDTLRSSLCRALSHLPEMAENESGLQILAWDENESRIDLPEPPEELFIHPNGEKYSVNQVGEFFIIYFEGRTIFHLYDLQNYKAIVCVKDIKKLPNYFLAGPFFEIFKRWSKKEGLNILHAGCISNNRHSILLVGKGGMGKSTTAIQCLIGGLNYLSDDYVLVKLGPKPMAYSIFCSGKLHNDHLKRFPSVSGLAFNDNPEVYDKPLMFMKDAFPERIMHQSPIKAICAPQITNMEASDYEPLSSFEALKALAPSTILQLGLADSNDLPNMADLTRSTPCYRLNLGSNLEEIPTTVSNLLDSL